MSQIYQRFIKVLNKNTLLLALVIAICMIVVGVGLGWYNNKVVPLNTTPIARYHKEPTNPLSFMANWDGVNYIYISQHGYTYVDQANYYPLYPMLIHYMNKVISSTVTSALVVSWLCLIGALYYYLRFLKLYFKLKDNISAVKGVMFLVLFPTSIFLVAAYASSLVVFTGIACLYYAFKKQYLAAGLFGLLTTIANTEGILILFAACIVLLEEKIKPLKVVATLVIGLIGLGAYSLYLDIKFSSPLSFILAQKSHGWLNFHYSELIKTITFFNLLSVILLIVAIIYWWNKRRSFAYLSFLFLLIPIVGNQFGGFSRYVHTAFPLQFMAFDFLKNKQLAYSLVLAAMAIAWAYFTLQFAGGYIGG